MSTRLGRLSLGARSPARDGLNPHDPGRGAGAEQLRDHMIRHAGLTPDSKVLDLGCGTGRLAEVLSGYLVSGHYRGYDVNRSYVEYCRGRHRFRRRFGFRHVDLRHREWNPGGRLRQLALPGERPGTLDLVLCLGVLYHQDFPGIAQIIQAIGPLLRYGGGLVATARLLNHHSMAHLGPLQYPHRTVDSWHADRRRPLLNVAVPEEGFRRLLIHNRLQIREPVRYGCWASAGGPLDPDLLVAVKV